MTEDSVLNGTNSLFIELSFSGEAHGTGGLKLTVSYTYCQEENFLTCFVQTVKNDRMDLFNQPYRRSTSLMI